MQLSATFYTSIGWSEEYSLTLAHSDLPAFLMIVDEIKVRIEPDYTIGSFTWDDSLEGEEYKAEARQQWQILGFRASISDEIPQPTSGVSQQYRRAAFEALQRVMVHLRNVTDDPWIDIYLSTFRVERYEVFDGTGRALEEWNRDYEFSSSDHALTDDDWRQITTRVLSNEVVSLHRDLILSARSFLIARNFNMSLVNAAIASEMMLYHLIVRKLVHPGQIGWVEPSQIDNPGKLAHAQQHGLLKETHVDRLAKVFNARNAIVHWKRPSITQQEAETAVDAAQHLEVLLVAG